MADSFSRGGGTMGTFPVFMTAISTILGAILFLRFGYAVANVGLIGALAIIVIGHLVTIPTAFAVAEIATNQKVEGGGAYYMISRSFGLNIGASIGIALFLSQAISVAFYVIAFAVAFEPVTEYLVSLFPYFPIPNSEQNRIVGLVMMLLLTGLMLSKGANIGVKALYFVVAILFVALGFFFMGKPYSLHSHSFTATAYRPDSFFYVFTIIFPAFTGIAAGLGLSGDLKDPKKSIPSGTLWATVVGIVIYILVCFKLFYSASLKDMAEDYLIMEKIAIWGPIIPIGLACAAISSALGSVMIAPRTLQALGVDNIFPPKLSAWFAKGKSSTNEPFNSSIITCVIAFIFVGMGDIDSVARIISMFFMVTYGAICMISFLEHFAADPSYRPTFRSKWYFSLFGAVLCIVLMFAMDPAYAIASLAIMVLIYIWASRTSKDERGLVKLFRGVIFQTSRELQVFLQKNTEDEQEESWRPFIICISRDTFTRRSALDQVRWLSHRYGFGTYIHFIEGLLSRETYEESRTTKERLLKLVEGFKSKVYIDTIISPSYTSAIAQSIQLSGVSGRGNNLILFEYSKGEPESLSDVIKNFDLLHSTDFDVSILRSSYKGFGSMKEIHIWISSQDYENSNLMILLAYIMIGHPDWKRGVIKIFSMYQSGEIEVQKERLLSLIQSGRLPISPNNINLMELKEDTDIKSVINQRSIDADLTILGFRGEVLMEDADEIFSGYDDLGNVLFVNAFKDKEIK